MIKNSFLRLSFFIFILIAQQVVWAETILDNSKIDSLFKRKLDWPEWSLPGPFKYSQLKKDLIYPSFFQGDWKVISIELNHTGPNIISYLVRFNKDSFGNVISDRTYNSMSIGKEIFGNELLDVKIDPLSPNRQLAIFKDSEFLETTIIGRNQGFSRDGIYLTDELSLQNFHSSSSTSRINQVETLSQYQYCKDLGIHFQNVTEDPICAEQWQAMYIEEGESLFPKLFRTNHFRLILISPKDQIPLNTFPIDLSNEKEFLVQGDQ